MSPYGPIATCRCAEKFGRCRAIADIAELAADSTQSLVTQSEPRGAEGYVKLRHDSLLQPWLSSRREVSWGWPVSAPAEAGGDIFKDRLDDVGVIVDTKLIRDG
jgi:hypothetical protein